MRLSPTVGALLASSLFLVAGTCKNKDTEDTAVADQNHAPIASAGADVSQPADEPVSLDAHGSYDPDGDGLTYHWSFEHLPDGSTLSLLEAPFTNNHTATGVTSAFTPDAVGTYVIKLTVNDGHLDSAADYLVVTTSEPANRPVANAGIDQIVSVGTSVTFDGSTSYDPQGRSLAYQWTLVDYPDLSNLTPASLAGATTNAAIIAPDVKGVYIVNLVVHNGLIDSAPDAAMVTVTSDNGDPTANAGEDITSEDCTSIPVDCTNSIDPDGDALVYFWELQSKPTASTATNANFDDRTAGATSFWADTAGNYEFSCAVSDGTSWSTPDQVKATAAERAYNTAPSVNAGTDKNVAGGTVTCAEDGYTYDCEDCNAVITELGDSATVTDADSDPLVYAWTVLEGDAAIADPTALSTHVTLSDAAPTEPDACEDTSYEFQLAVTDCTGAQVTDKVVIIVTCCGELAEEAR